MINKEGDCKELTDEQVKAMPVWKRVCFELMPWNSNFDPESIEEWAEHLGYMSQHTGTWAGQNERILDAVNAANNWIAVVQGLIDNYTQNDV